MGFGQKKGGDQKKREKEVCKTLCTPSTKTRGGKGNPINSWRGTLRNLLPSRVFVRVHKRRKQEIFGRLDGHFVKLCSAARGKVGTPEELKKARERPPVISTFGLYVPDCFPSQMLGGGGPKNTRGGEVLIQSPKKGGAKWCCLMAGVGSGGILK